MQPELRARKWKSRAIAVTDKCKNCAANSHVYDIRKACCAARLVLSARGNNDAVLSMLRCVESFAKKTMKTDNESFFLDVQQRVKQQWRKK